MDSLPAPTFALPPAAVPTASGAVVAGENLGAASALARLSTAPYLVCHSGFLIDGDLLSEEEIAEQIAAQYAVQRDIAHSDVREFLESLAASGVLLFPPYLTEAPQDGIVAHVKAVCAATGLGVVFYNRANARIGVDALAELADACPNLVGFKDGIGDIELMTRVYARFGDRFTYIGGLPTAETFALPYLELGVTTYSSAIFNFVPRFALDFFADVRAGDRAAVYRRLNDFVLPYLDIRDRRKGYAVSIIKAGLTAVGRSGGPVRPPLTDLTAEERSALTELVGRIAAQA